MLDKSQARSLMPLARIFLLFVSGMLRQEHYVNIRQGSEIPDTTTEVMHGNDGGGRNTRIIWCENNLRNVRFEDLIVGFGLALKNM